MSSSDLGGLIDGKTFEPPSAFWDFELFSVGVDCGEIGAHVFNDLGGPGLISLGLDGLVGGKTFELPSAF